LDFLHAIDVSLFRVFNTDLAHPWLDQAMLAISDRLTWVAVAVIAIATAFFKRGSTMLPFVVSLGLTLGVADLVTYQVLKPTFARARPCYQLEAVRLVTERCGSDYGFPSNHAANSMASAVAIALAVRRRVAAWPFVIAVLVGASRVYLGVHFPFDVLAGFVVGALTAWGVHAAFQRAMLRWGRSAS
jgi:undecaprenyl-diphosphatase